MHATQTSPALSARSTGARHVATKRDSFAVAVSMAATPPEPSSTTHAVPSGATSSAQVEGALAKLSGPIVRDMRSPLERLRSERRLRFSGRAAARFLNAAERNTLHREPVA